jgi:hypothetical protein
MIGIISSDLSLFPFYHHCPVLMMAATTRYDTIRFDATGLSHRGSDVFELEYHVVPSIPAETSRVPSLSRYDTHSYKCDVHMG